MSAYLYSFCCCVLLRHGRSSIVRALQWHEQEECLDRPRQARTDIGMRLLRIHRYLRAVRSNGVEGQLQVGRPLQRSPPGVVRQLVVLGKRFYLARARTSSSQTECCFSDLEAQICAGPHAFVEHLFHVADRLGIAQVSSAPKKN